MKQVSEGIYTVQGLFLGRVYIIESTDGLTMIDSSIAGAHKKIGSELAKIGRQISDIRRILITHAHPDHIGSLAAVQQASGAAVYVHARDAAVVRGERPVVMAAPDTLSGLPKVLSRLMPVPKMAAAPVDREFAEGDTFVEVLPDLTVVETPGHTSGHSAFWLPSRRLLFCGDTVMAVDRMRLPMAMATVDMAEARRSIRKIADMDVDILCPGHGKPIIGNAGAVLRKFAAKVGM